MKIFFVSLFLPQEKAYHAGGRYVYELIKGLSKDHEITLATRLDEKETHLLEPLGPLCKEIHPYSYRSGDKRGPVDIVGLVLNYLGFSLFADRLAAEGGYDLIQVEWTEAGILMKRRATPMVLDAHDVITKPAERRYLAATGLTRVAALIAYRLVRAIERHIAGKFDLLFTRSDNDRDYLFTFAPDARVAVAPHPAGLDITAKELRREPGSILFLASYKYRKTNVDGALFFYRSVFPLVRERVPHARFIIAGYGPPLELTALEAADPAVSVPGFVEDLDETYKRAAVFVAPILVGGGIIVKVLDAMAAGTPVVATTYGNEGVGAVAGRDLLVADDAREMADAVVRILEDRELSDSLSMNGREFVRRNFSPASVLGRIESAYEELVVDKGGKRGERL